MIHSLQMTIVVLVLVVLLCDIQRGKMSVSLTNSQVLHVLKILAAHPLEIAARTLAGNRCSVEATVASTKWTFLMHLLLKALLVTSSPGWAQ